MGEFFALIVHHIGGIAAAAGITLGHDYFRHRKGQHHLSITGLFRHRKSK